ncbi:MAG: S8 family peptidase, partial [Calditrichota bacterium]
GDINGIDDDGNGYIDDVIGWDFTDAPDFPDNGDYLDPDNDPMDEYPGGHGTPVAGIIAAQTNNAIGIAGVAPNIRVMALRAGTASGYLEEDDVAEAIIYAVQNGCKIINMSFGDVVFSNLLKEAVEYGYQHGLLFVASAGNSGNNILQYPASYDETISVGATDIDNNLASFSSFGSKLVLVAPGQDILSTSRNGEYGTYSGTSFSAPMVSGVLALLWSLYPQKSAKAVEADLLNGCKDLGTLGWDQYYGQGITNAYGSLTTFATAYARISSPPTSSGTNSNIVPVIGTAVSPNLGRAVISYGTGENPVIFTPFQELTENVLEDTLGFWQTAQLPEDVYTLELKVINSDQTALVDRVIIHLDRSLPVIDSLKIIPVVEQIQGEVEVYFRIENNAGLETIDDNNGMYYQLVLSQPLIFDQDFVEIASLTGFGYFLNRSEDIDGDGIQDIFGNIGWPGQEESRISHISYRNGQLTRDIGPVPAFARNIEDIDGDNHPELLVGYGSNSSIFPGTSLPQFSINPVTSDMQDFWAVKMIDLDNDNQFEIIALHQNQWAVFEIVNTNNFNVSIRQFLENPTTGENNYGVPFVEVTDLNQNSRLNLVLGDYDGDLIVYELNTNGEFIPVSWMRLPGVDATNCFAVGNFDDDPANEIAVATKVLADYNGESAVNSQYWVLSVLKLNQSNTLEKVWETNFHKVNELKNNYTGVSADDFNGDGLDEIFFTPYPNGYYIAFQDDHYELKSYLQGLNSNAVLKVSDNQICLQGDSTIFVLEREDPGIRPLVPSDFRVSYVDTGEVQLNWNPVLGAGSYLISRWDFDISVEKEIMITASTYNDSTVLSGHLYLYKILSVDSSYSIPRSKFSAPIKIRAETMPVFVGLAVEGEHQLLLSFSKPLGGAATEVSKFTLYPGQKNPSVSANLLQQLHIDSFFVVWKMNIMYLSTKIH